MKISGGRRFIVATLLPACTTGFQNFRISNVGQPFTTTASTSRNFQSVKKRDGENNMNAKFSMNLQKKFSLAPLYAENSKVSSSSLSVDVDVITTEPINGNSEVINGDATPSSKMTTANKYKSLLDEVGLSGQVTQVSNLPLTRQVTSNDIFCNRELKLSALSAIGFDMDYTLAQYQQPAFDKLAFDGAKEKLVQRLGYPKEVLDFDYSHEFWVRGLVIDTQRGNFLKIDRHKYVRLAYHGFEEISSSTRKFLYSRSFNKIPSFSEKQYVKIDTLFQHVDAHLFAHLITLKDRGDFELLDEKTYEEIYREVRECVDLCHRGDGQSKDGVIKDEVARNPDKYIIYDELLIPMLKNYKKAGIKLFLLTNSYWEYTSVAMNYLYHGEKVDDELKKKNEWLELFDLVVVGSCKPAYLVDPYLNLFRVNPADGSLLNTDGLFEIEALGENGAQKFLDKGKVFQGGNWLHLQKMLGTRAGEEILYVGDHLYSDVLRSKRTLGWRTALIVPEIEKEMEVFSEQKETNYQITELRKLRDDLSAHADLLKRQCDDSDATAVEELEQKLADIERDDQIIKDKLAEIAKDYHAAFHPVWGQMFLSGYQDSRFAFYVQNYACIYTAKATNLGLVSTERSFRTSGEMLPHDKMLIDPASSFIKEDK